MLVTNKVISTKITIIITYNWIWRMKRRSFLLTINIFPNLRQQPSHPSMRTRTSLMSPWYQKKNFFLSRSILSIDLVLFFVYFTSLYDDNDFTDVTLVWMNWALFYPLVFLVLVLVPFLVFFTSLYEDNDFTDVTLVKETLFFH